jgi:DNA modification methylase
MSAAFAERVTGRRGWFAVNDVLDLLDQDCFQETFVQRSRVIDYLEAEVGRHEEAQAVPNPEDYELRLGHALDLIKTVPDESVQCVVTSTPYWGMRVYDDTFLASWADGEICAFGHEQTPEGFARHTIEVLLALSRVVSQDGSLWWNVMDSFNTRGPVRTSAAETLRAMQGRDGRKWAEHAARRYSAGHSYLKDGEQCMIPALIAERASRIGLYAKAMITWAKRASLPEPQNSRVSRNLEYVIHLSRQRAPKFSRSPYHETAPKLGGRDNGWEPKKLSDVWSFNTSAGGDGHGAQFPLALPGRCIALSTTPGDLVLDPFVGSGNAGVAALHHGCRFLGFDVSQTYLAVAKGKLERATEADRGLAAGSTPM